MNVVSKRTTGSCPLADNVHETPVGSPDPLKQPACRRSGDSLATHNCILIYLEEICTFSCEVIRPSLNPLIM